MDVIDRIAAAPTDRRDRPVNDIRIITIRPVETPQEEPADSAGVRTADSLAVHNADSTAAPEVGSLAKETEVKKD